MKRGQAQFSIASMLLLTSIAAVLIAMPRLTAGAMLHPTTILWVVTLHQITLASTIALICWLVLGRRLWVGIALAIVIAVLWGPNLAATIEQTATGKNSNSLAFVDAIGVTPYLNQFYSTTYTWLGYDYKVKD